MTRPPRETAMEQGVWERVKKTVSPLKDRKQDGPATKPAFLEAKTRPPQSRLPAHKAARPPGPPAKPRCATSEDRSAHKKVRRGQIDVQGRVDLHGKTHDQARAHLLRRLREYATENARTILVITGRGVRDEGVLRTRLPDWMGETGFRSLVSGYAPAHVRHGGKGAWYVFLRKPVPITG